MDWEGEDGELEERWAGKAKKPKVEERRRVRGGGWRLGPRGHLVGVGSYVRGG